MSGFFGHLEKTQLLEKLKQNFWGKLNEPEDISIIIEENSTCWMNFFLLLL